MRPLGRALLCPTIETSAACESVSVFARSKAEETAVTTTTTAPATTNSQGAAFPNDLRSTSGIGKGDNLETHTSKWLSVRHLFSSSSSFQTMRGREKRTETRPELKS